MGRPPPLMKSFTVDEMFGLQWLRLVLDRRRSIRDTIIAFKLLHFTCLEVLNKNNIIKPRISQERGRKRCPLYFPVKRLEQVETLSFQPVTILLPVPNGCVILPARGRRCTVRRIIYIYPEAMEWISSLPSIT